MISDLTVCSMETEDKSNQWIMNPDCCRLVFDRLRIQDVVRCERVSRGWQRAVKEYLTGVHDFWVDCDTVCLDDMPKISFENKRGLYNIKKREIFYNMIQKMGPYMKSLIVHVDIDQLRDVVDYCPYLEELTLFKPSAPTEFDLVKAVDHITRMVLYTGDPFYPSGPTKLDLLKTLKHIRRILLHTIGATDDQLNEILKIESLEELAMFDNSMVVGKFFTNLNQNLKILKISGCEIIVPEQIKSCASWPGMKHLQLADVMAHVYDKRVFRLQHLPLLLDKMPNLEYFAFTSAPFFIDFDDTFLKSISRLSQLRELYLCHGYFVTYDFLTRVARALERLQRVDVSDCCNLTPAGVLELCRLRPTLKGLGLGNLPLSDADVEACVRYCEDLEYLNITFSDVVTPGVLQRIARPRVRPLHIQLGGRRKDSTDALEKLEDLKITWT